MTDQRSAGLRGALLARLFTGLFSLVCLCTPAAFAEAEFYALQVASFSSRSSAEVVVDKLRAEGLDAYWLRAAMPSGEIRYRVRIGRFATRGEANASGEQLRNVGTARDFLVTAYEAPSSANTPTIAHPAPPVAPAEILIAPAPPVAPAELLAAPAPPVAPAEILTAPAPPVAPAELLAAPAPPVAPAEILTAPAPPVAPAEILTAPAPPVAPAEPRHADAGPDQEPGPRCRPLASFLSPRWVAWCALPPSRSSRSRAAR